MLTDNVTTQQIIEPPADFWDWVETDLEHVMYSDTDSVYLIVDESIIPYDLDNTDQLIKIGKYIGETIDAWISNYYIDVILPKCGINPKHNKVQFKNELCAIRLMLLDVKKNYAYLPVAIKNKKLDKKSVTAVGLAVLKSNTAEMSADLMQELLDVFVFGLDENNKIDIDKISYNDMNTKLQTMSARYGKNIISGIKKFDLVGLGAKVKWNSSTAETYYTIVSMKFFNLLMDEEVFKPMVAGTLVPLTIGNMNLLKKYKSSLSNKHDIDLSKVNYIAVPLIHEKYVDRLQVKFKELNISINPQDIWNGLVSSGCDRILEVLKSHTKQNK